MDEQRLEYIPICPSPEGRKTLTLRVTFEPEGTTRVEVLDPGESPPAEEACSR
jgi:hypothetical protein